MFYSSRNGVGESGQKLMRWWVHVELAGHDGGHRGPPRPRAEMGADQIFRTDPLDSLDADAPAASAAHARAAVLDPTFGGRFAGRPAPRAAPRAAPR